MLSLRPSATSVVRRAAFARTFASTPRALSGASVHANDPEIIQKEKDRNLSGKQHETSSPHKKHAPGWNEHLASDAEANIKVSNVPHDRSAITNRTSTSSSG
ncbi:hypothetical protein FRC03_008164 [Tulasnella sp. 419]|nr:hypothetical protein FRC03_008164 [Tulasnella sp. 419]